MGDDIGQFNISAYNLGMMGYRTLNIDRIAKKGTLFTDWYSQQSCTARRCGPRSDGQIAGPKGIAAVLRADPAAAG